MSKNLEQKLDIIIISIGSLIEPEKSLMDINIEKVIVNHFEKLLYDDFNNSWLCNEKKGQAILVWGTKK